MKQPTWILGVDAGGTKTTARLARLVSADQTFDTAIELVGEGRTGPGNPMAVGFSQATANLQQAIQVVCQAAEITPREIAAACLGIAGAGRIEEQQRILTWMNDDLHAAQVHVTTDATIVLASLHEKLTAHQLDQMQGVALISGTGSMAWGRNANGAQTRCGGWGYLLGDEGSGYWIGRQGLQAACRAVDGRGVNTQLVEAFTEYFQLKQWNALVPKVYHPNFQRSDLAALAPIVVGLAESDAVAAAILDAAADELLSMIHVTAEHLGLAGTEFSVGLAGGTLTESPNLVLRLRSKATALWSKCPMLRTVSRPVSGALILSAHLAIHGKSLD